jgi:ABC-type Fe3+ transport system substrate-binding protein
MSRKPLRLLTIGVLVIVGALILAACGGDDPTPTPRPTATPLPGATPTPTPSQTPAEIEWEETIAAAQAEGKLVAATFTDPELEIILKQFEQTFGIEVEQVPGRPSRQAGQILTEQQAGQYNFDVLWHPVTNISITLKPNDGLEPILQFLILDELLDDDTWYGGVLGGMTEDPLFTFFDGISGNSSGFQVNYDVYPEGTINDWPDLINEAYRGQIGIYFPARPATASIALACAQPMFASDAEWEAFVRALFALEPTTDGQFRTVGDWLAQGRFPLAVGGGSAYFDELKSELELNMGDPLGTNFCAGTPSGTGRGLSVAKNPPHINAAKVFINWVLTQPIQQQLVNLFEIRGEERLSRRKDVTHPDPEFAAAAIDGFLNRWMKGGGLLQTDTEALAYQQRVLSIAAEFGY